MATQPIHFQTGPSVPLYCGDGVSLIASGSPIIQRVGAILPSGLDAGLLSVWTYGSGGSSGGDIYNLAIWGNAQNTSGPYAPRITAEFYGGGMTFSLVSSALTDLGYFNSLHEGIAGCTVHHLLSFRISTGQVLYYVNDAAQPASYTPGAGGTFGATSSTTVTTQWVASAGGGGTLTGGGFYADAWFNPTGSFVDLSITANRRHFINADLTPVDLGSNGQNPLGSPPVLYQSVATGGVPSDWLINRGSFGGTFSLFTGTLGLDGNPCIDSGGDVIHSLTDAELYFNPTSGFVDFSNTDNRRKFVSPTGAAQWLGAEGDLPFGVPSVYLSAEPGDAAAFARNEGAAEDFAISGTIDLAGSAPACTTYITTEAADHNANPEWRLSTSDDGGRTWGLLVKPRGIGKTGEYLTRLRWLKLGHARERMIRLESSDSVRRNIVGFYYDATEGMG